MARLSVDAELGRDTRLEDLAEFCGWSKRETAGCLQLDIWPLCYDRVTPNIPARDLERAAARGAVSPVLHPGGFVGALIAARLGRPSTRHDTHFVWIKKDKTELVLPWKDVEWRDRIYVTGAAERIAYLVKSEESGRTGGIKSAESRAKSSKGPLKGGARVHEAIGSRSVNPSASASASALPSAVAGDRDIGAPATPPPFQASGSDGEIESARRVLAKLSEHNGVEYRDESHARIVIERMREGASELELRAIVLYAVEVLRFSDEKMRGNLSPQVLFGTRQKLEKYLDPARSTYREQIAAEIAAEAKRKLARGAA